MCTDGVLIGPVPSRSGLARDARPSGPIAIVQSYVTVWSTEQQDPKQDLRASGRLDHRPSGARDHGTAHETPSYRAAESITEPQI